MKARYYILLVFLISINAGFLLTTLYLVYQIEEAYPPIGALVDVNGYRIHLRDSDESNPVLTGKAADKRTVVFLHGSGANLRDFESETKASLQQYYRVVTVDRPGHGYSERGNPRSIKIPEAYLGNDPGWINPAAQAALIASALEKIGIEESIWVGHSWAASVVLAALVANDHRVTAGVLINGVTHPSEKKRTFHENISQLPVIGDVFRWQYITPMGHFAINASIEKAFYPETPPANYRQEAGLHLALRPDAYKHRLEDSVKLPGFLVQQSQYYSGIKRPLLSIASDSDELVPLESHHQQLKEQVQHLKEMVFQGTGHALHQTQSDRVFDAITTFVRSVKAR